MGKDISYEGQGKTYNSYLADGSNGKPAPGILVIHEANGLGPHAKQRADMLAELGYVALAADLFGEFGIAFPRAMEIVGQLSADPAELRARMNTALDVLRQQPNVDGSKLASIGFCFGGSASLELGRSGADISAIVGFHSGLRAAKPEDSVHIKAKVLVCMGDADSLVNREQRDAFMDNMTASNVDAQMLLMSNVGHSFTNVEADSFNMPGVKFDAKADKRAWKAMQDLFAEVF